MNNLQVVKKAANDFIVSRLDRKGVAITLRSLARSCDRNCSGCPVPQTVTSHFSGPILIFLKSELDCLKSQ